jgi:hypothetical protein
MLVLLRRGIVIQAHLHSIGGIPEGIIEDTIFLLGAIDATFRHTPSCSFKGCPLFMEGSITMHPA